MIIAKSEKFEHIFTGPEFHPKIHTSESADSHHELTCPVCEKAVTYNNNPRGPFEFFRHDDGSDDCFDTNGTSDEHRLMIEIAMKSLHNRIREVTGEPVEIGVERWIGSKREFVIADVRVTSPLKIVAETFYRSDKLGLGRRFETIFKNGYRSYLIFHRDGRHNVDCVEHHLQQVAPLRVGRFNPDELELTLGDLFSSPHFELTDQKQKLLPNYIAYSL